MVDYPGFHFASKLYGIESKMVYFSEIIYTLLCMSKSKRKLFFTKGSLVFFRKFNTHT